MEASLLRQIRVLQILVAFLLVITAVLCVNLRFPFLPARFNTIDAGQLRIRESDGTLKAALSNSAGFSRIGDSRSQQQVRFSGLMFYNQEGEEEGGLVYSGKAMPGGQDAGKIGTRRLFLGNRRGVENGQPYDEAGLFIKNRWGRDAIKLYVDYDNKPHLDVFDPLGKVKTYELKLEKQGG